MIEKLATLETRYENLNGMLCDPNVLADQAELRRLAKERAELEEVVAAFREYRKTLQELEEARSLLKVEKDGEFKEYLHGEIQTLSCKKESLEQTLTELLLPKDPYADKNIFLEIRAGAGGEEAALFAAELFRMYSKYAEKMGWKTELMNLSPTELGGIKEAILSISGKNVYSNLKFESGVHRVQRVPATEASGRIHTSTVTMAVLVEPDEVEVQVNPADLRIDTYRSSGAGGQHVNKTDSAVRITHLPTGIVVACQDERSQHQNRDKAMRILRAKLLERQQRDQEMEIAKSRKMQVGTGERSEKIRTYNFPQSRVTDHRIGLTVHGIERILEGEIQEFIEALMMDERRRELEKVG